MIITMISDTHNRLSEVMPTTGDILIHAGDHTNSGSINQMSKALDELKEYGKNYKHIVTICGNHDWIGERQPEVMNQLCADRGLIYLNQSNVELMGKKFYGAAEQPEFCSWAFNVQRGDPLKRIWAKIPDDTNILITHGPVDGILDLCPDGSRVGCKDLYDRVLNLKLDLHVSGHIHHSYGMINFNGTTFVNACSCDEQYVPINKPITIDIE